MAGKREELKAFYNKKVAPQHAPQQPAPAEPEPATVAQQKKGGLRKIIEHLFEMSDTMSDNKLVKTVIEAVTLTGLAAGIGWAAKKVVKENFTSDPSNSTMIYADSIALRQYLEDQKIIPNN